MDDDGRLSGLLWGYASALVAVNLLALVSGVLVRRTRLGWIGLLLAFYMGVINRGYLEVPGAVLGWWNGSAMIGCCGLPVTWPEPDRETRLPVSCSCTCDVREVQIPNTVLLLLHRIVGPATGTWQGVIPEASEGAALIAARGEALILHPIVDNVEVRLFGGPCVWMGEWRGQRLTLWSCREVVGENPPVFEPWTPRVVELEERGLLVADGDRLSVWVPYDGGNDGPIDYGPIDYGTTYSETWTLKGDR